MSFRRTGRYITNYQPKDGYYITSLWGTYFSKKIDEQAYYDVSSMNNLDHSTTIRG